MPVADFEQFSEPVSGLMQNPELSGLALFQLMTSTDSWIHRRVETIQLLTGETIKRRVSVDFSVSETDVNELTLAGSKQFVIPLAFMKKEKLREFDLSKDGKPVSALGRIENGALSVALLRWACRFALDDSNIGSPLDKAILECVDAVVASEDTNGMDGVSRLIEMRENGDPQATAILDTSASAFLLNALQESFLLFAVLEPPHGRMIVKYSHHELYLGLGANTQIDAFVRALRDEPQLNFLLSVPTAAFAASYHCEIEVPEELRIDVAILANADGPGMQVHDLEFEVDHASLHSQGFDLSDDPVVQVLMRPERPGVPTVAAVVSVVTSLILLLGSTWGNIDASGQSSTAISVLFTMSALYTGWIVRSGEHRLVKSLFLLPRALFTTTALASLAAATSLAYGASNCTLHDVWLVSGLTAGVCSLLLVRFWWTSADSIRRR